MSRLVRQEAEKKSPHPIVGGALFVALQPLQALQRGRSDLGSDREDQDTSQHEWEREKRLEAAKESPAWLGLHNSVVEVFVSFLGTRVWEPAVDLLVPVARRGELSHANSSKEHGYHETENRNQQCEHSFLHRPG